MKLTALRPMIYTDQLEDTIRFYTDMLGFILAGKNEDWGWASLYKDQVSIMLAKPHQHEDFEKPVFTGSFYFNTDEVDALWQSLKDKVKVCYPIENFEWEVREFAIYDNNGYLLQFGQDIAALK
jgi:catechol 2,3-dioxygenase-like lactoylglutathione lyase family enzyme